MEDILNFEDPFDFDWISSEDPDQRYVKVEFATHMSPSIPKVEAHASNKSAMSNCCRFAQAVLSLPLWKDLMQILTRGLNKVIVASLMGYVGGLFCMPTVHYGVN